MAKTVLIVEDEPSMQRALKSKLEHGGYDVQAASDGEEAVTILKTVVPDLVLLDLIMPKIDGISVLRQMKEDDRLRPVPVVILTNLSSGDKVAEAMALGTFDFLVKANYSLDDVLKKVTERIGAP
jgi:CheY-like chemotaxis protein